MQAWWRVPRVDGHGWPVAVEGHAGSAAEVAGEVGPNPAGHFWVACMHAIDFSSSSLRPPGFRPAGDAHAMKPMHSHDFFLPQNGNRRLKAEGHPLLSRSSFSVLSPASFFYSVHFYLLIF
jgi:hypothetical protein